MYKKTYDHLYLEKLGSVFERTKTRSYEMFSPSPEQIVLDVGCGIGNDVVKLAGSGATIYGIDHDSNLIDIAKSKAASGNIKFIRCEADKIPLATGAIDKIRFDRVLQHIENHRDVIKETARLLKKDGQCHIVDIDYFSLSLFMPNKNLERKLIDAIAYKRFKGGWQIRNLSSLFKAHDFQITDFEIQNYIFDDNETINYLYRFDKIIGEEFEQNNITEAEIEDWNDFKNSQMRLSLNVLLIVARKS